MSIRTYVINTLLFKCIHFLGAQLTKAEAPMKLPTTPTLLLTGPDPKSQPTVGVHTSGCLCLQPEQWAGTLTQINMLLFLTEREKVICFSLRAVRKPDVFRPLVQVTVECEWQRRETQTVTVPVPHILSFGELFFLVCTEPCLFEQTLVHHGQLGSVKVLIHPGHFEVKQGVLGQLDLFLLS